MRHSDDPNLLVLTEKATRVCQNNPRSIAYMKFHALLLSELFSGRDVQTAIRRAEERIGSAAPEFGQEIKDKIRKAVEEQLHDTTAATLKFGQACPLVKSFPAAIHTLIKHPDDFEGGILATLRAGGDNAGRASMLGAWLGAHLGIRKIPKAWKSRLNQGERISAAIEKILPLRSDSKASN